MGYIKDLLERGYTPEKINDYEIFIYPYILEKICKVSSKDISILDAGAGTGHILFPLMRKGYKNLYAVDIENEMEEFFKKLKINFRQVDLEKDILPYPEEKFDVIFSKNVIEHMVNPSRMMKEFYRVLKKGGILIIITDDWRKTYKTFYRDPTHVHPYDKEGIKRLLTMYNFQVTYLSSFLSKFGIGKLKLYKWFPKLAFIGDFLIAIAKKG